MTDAFSRGRENPEKLKQSFLSATSISSIIDPRCIFGIGTFSRESIREHSGRLIVDRQSLILFGIDKIGLVFRMYILNKVLIPINTRK
jgi:hypothetical protein